MSPVVFLMRHSTKRSVAASPSMYAMGLKCMELAKSMVSNVLISYPSPSRTWPMSWMSVPLGSVMK